MFKHVYGLQCVKEKDFVYEKTNYHMNTVRRIQLTSELIFFQKVAIYTNKKRLKTMVSFTFSIIRYFISYWFFWLKIFYLITFTWLKTKFKVNFTKLFFLLVMKREWSAKLNATMLQFVRNLIFIYMMYCWGTHY